MPKILGHSTRYREEKATPAIRIVGIRPRGVVDVLTPADVDRTLIDMPTSVTVLYIPVNAIPVAGNVDAERLLASGALAADADIPEHGGPVTVRVPGVLPGDYDVQLILNYPDQAPA